MASEESASRCDHPLGVVERRGAPDWKDNSRTIWYPGFCTGCGDSVVVYYRHSEVEALDA